MLFVIRSLDRGGAERQIIELLGGIDQKRFEVALATFYDGGGLRPEAENISGVNVYSLKKKRRWDFQWIVRLGALVRTLRPEIIVGYLSTGNWSSVVGAKLAGSKVVWAIRGSDNREMGHYGWSDQASFHLARLLSRFADLVIFNSEAGRRYYLERGYACSRTMVIPNGIATDHFVRQDEAGLRLRRQWEVPAAAPLIGLVARLDPVKDHPTFLRAASLLLLHRPDARFVCVGSGPLGYARELRRLADGLGLASCIRWAGQREDMPAVYSAIDIATLCTPYGEGFPNAIAEAMSCGTPCVVTPAGDSASIVGEHGIIVKAQCPEELAKGWSQLLARADVDRERLKTAARNWIVGKFRKQLMVTRMETALSSV